MVEYYPWRDGRRETDCKELTKRRMTMMRMHWVQGVKLAPILVTGMMAICVAVLLFNSRQAVGASSCNPSCNVYHTGCVADNHPACTQSSYMGGITCSSTTESQSYSYMLCGAGVPGGEGCANSISEICGKSRKCYLTYTPGTAIWYCTWTVWSNQYVSACSGCL